jgi:aspartyl aminopeptidase
MVKKHKENDILDLMNFLNSSPSAWHAVDNVKTKLEQTGFKQLFEEEVWKLKPGGQYFVIRNGSSLCAFVVPLKRPDIAHVVGSHTDSPGFKLKPNPEFRRENMIMLGVEVYGGPLITSWLNRDLGIAGRITYTDAKGNIGESLVRLDENPVVLPQLAIHLDRQVNETGLLLNKQEHLNVLAGLVDDKNDKISYLEGLLKQKLSYKDLLGFDLFLFPIEQASLVGINKQMIASYRIDNLNGVCASVSALCHSNEPSQDVLKVIALWDNEEIGSDTAQGAGSPFLAHTIERITLALKMNREEYLCLMQKSLCVSVDLGHALHPNYMEKHEANHRLLMQHGIIVKYNSQHKYASDARSAAKIIDLCRKNRIPMQKFVNRNDIPCGSTIGPIHAHITGMATVDIGCAQLSMHSARELTSCQDYSNMRMLLTAFLK